MELGGRTPNRTSSCVLNANSVLRPNAGSGRSQREMHIHAIDCNCLMSPDRVGEGSAPVDVSNGCVTEILHRLRMSMRRPKD